MVNEPLPEEKVGTPPPGSEQADGPPAHESATRGPAHRPPGADLSRGAGVDATPLDARAQERPYSLQAEEGAHHAAPDEHAPYRRVPPADTLGVKHIEEALHDLSFPMTRAQLLARAGDWRIPVTGASFRRLHEYMQGVDVDRFRSAEDVTAAIRQARRKGRSHWRGDE